ncbi:MAG: nucleotidyltransferase family protein [Nitrososphaerales archaeon]
MDINTFYKHASGVIHNIRAVVIAGGRGTRLYPLTRNRAKCMLPINGKPLLEHVIRYLASYGFTEIVVTVGKKRKQIVEYFGDGSKLGVSLLYSLEKKALGTAGSFKNAEKLISNTTLVMQGDTLTDFNLNKIMSFHKKKKALATIAVTRAEDTKEYGVVGIDAYNRIIDFWEKPKESMGNLVNSGIYVLERDVLNLIPENTKFDFSGDLFPLLLKRRLPFYALEMEGYWFDIGTPENYKKAVEYAMRRYKVRKNINDRLLS